MSEYYIPANYTDAGKLFGLFEIRNGIEAVVLSLPLLYLCFKLLSFSVTANIIITMTIVIPVGGFALIGINDDCLTRFIKTWWTWRRNRGILTFRGADKIKGKAGKLK